VTIWCNPLAQSRTGSNIERKMIYCVVPRPLADELYPRLVEHYGDDDNVTVIVDRRQFDRRARYAAARAASAGEDQRRIVRDRRRARVPGDLLPLAHAS
jgi:hypothetical protein